MPAALNAYGFLIVLMVLGALLALSLYLPLMAGQLSLASPGFYSLGGYIGAVASTRLVAAGAVPLPLLLAEMAGAGLASALLALLVGAAVLRLAGIYLALATIAFVEILRVLALNLEITGGAVGIFAIPPPFGTQLSYLWVAGPLLVASMVFVARLERGRAGRALRAIREDGLASAAMGIDVARSKLLAFTLGAVLAGVTGAVAAHFLNTWNARQGTFDASVLYLAFVLIGGSRTYAGPVAGAFVLTYFPELLRGQSQQGALPPWVARFLGGDGRLIVFGSLLALGCVFFPRGFVTPELLARLGYLRRARLRRAGPEFPRRADSPVRVRRQVPPETSARVTSAGERPGPVLELDGLTCRFGGVTAIDGVSLAVRRGEILGLIGPNGAGKTTLFNVVTGFARPTAGRVLHEGSDVTARLTHEIARRGIARTFQNVRLFNNLSALENVLVARHTHLRSGLLSGVARTAGARAEEGRAVARAGELLSLVGLSGREGVKAASFPYGDQRRLEIARALALEPEVLLLDEPAAGMNGAERAALSDLTEELRERFELTVLLIEHHVPLVMGLCDRIAVLHLGRLIALGEPGAVRRDPAVVEAYLGEEG